MVQADFELATQPKMSLNASHSCFPLRSARTIGMEQHRAPQACPCWCCLRKQNGFPWLDHQVVGGKRLLGWVFVVATSPLLLGDKKCFQTHRSLLSLGMVEVSQSSGENRYSLCWAVSMAGSCLQVPFDFPGVSRGCGGTIMSLGLQFIVTASVQGSASAAVWGLPGLLAAASQGQAMLSLATFC